MKIYNKVIGSMETVSAIEINVDTVYIRSNIKPINSDDFKGWEYDETQYTVNEYIGFLATSIANLEERLQKLETK